MALGTIEIAFISGICGFTLVVAIYELTTGRIPGDPVKRGLWGYRWLTTPARQRAQSIAGLLVVIGFLVLVRPFSLPGLAAGVIGILLGVAVTISDAHSRSPK